MMDQNHMSFVAHATHHFLCPAGVESVTRILAMIPQAEVARAYDIGCGFGAMASHAADQLDVEVIAVDRSPLMIAEGRRRLSGRTGRGKVTFQEGLSGDFLKGAGEADLVMAVGAVALTDGSQEPAPLLKALSASVRSGGYLLWGESLWKRPPSEMLKAVLGPVASVYASHTDYVMAGDGAGLSPVYASTTSEAELDEYNWRYISALEAFARNSESQTDASAARLRAQGLRGLYLTEMRETLGFGLYLFRKP